MKIQTSKIIIGLMLATLTHNAFADTVVATEPFVRGGVANAKSYADTIVNAARSDLNDAIATKQNTLPTAAGNTGKVLGVVDGMGTIGWIEQSETDVSGKANLQTGSTVGHVATMDMSGQYVDSGTALTDLTTTTDVSTAVSTAVANKSDLQTGSTVGHVATMDMSGQYVDSGTALTDLATTTDVSTAVANKSDLQSGAVAGNVATMNMAGQYVDSGTALTDLATTTDVSTAVSTAVANKSDLQSGAVAGNVATMNMAGQYVDSGTALSNLATTTDVSTGLSGKENTIIGGLTNTGKVIIGTETGWNWASTTGDTFIE